MKTRIPFIILATSLMLLLIISSRLQSQNPTRMSTGPLTSSPVDQFTNSSSDPRWKKVDSLSSLGLPKSALEIVNKILLRAQKDKDNSQYIKAILYKFRLQSEFEEDFLVQTMKELKSEISTSAEPVKQILQSLLAEIYWRYYQNNRYRFDDRTQVLSNREDSIQTWDLNTLSGKITGSYLMSLENPPYLKGIPVEQFKDIIVPKDPKQEGRDPFRPTLYDFLAWRALDYFMSNNRPVKVSVSAFQIDNPEFYSQTPGFLKINLQTGNSQPPSPSYYAMGLFQELAAFHFNDQNPQALIDEELQRFSFVLQEGAFENKDSLYLEALKRFETDHLFSPWSTDISYQIANFLYIKGQGYSPLKSAFHKWEIKSADAYCESAIKRFPNSDGAKNCRALEKTILQPSLEITTEYGINPDKPSLALLKYRNIQGSWFRLIKTDPEINQEKTSSMNHEEILKYYLQMTPVKTWTQTLSADGDFQRYSVEITIPPVSNGYYILLVSSGKEFAKDDQAIAFNAFYSTHISYISRRTEKGGYDVYILDREIGMPVKNVSVESWTRYYDYQSRKYISKKMYDYTTDENGYFSILLLATGTNYTGLVLKVKENNVVFISDNLYQYPNSEVPPKPVLHTYFFTDRAIYRPGQIIYFKGIILEQTGENHQIRPNLKTTVTFTDVNSQKISEQNLVTNEFGSFNGSFTAPRGVLLGQMTISNGSGSVSVSMEEYKRPTFDVTFEPVEGNYHIGDSVSLTGKAIAFAGNRIDGAMVNYTVTRRARFPFRYFSDYIPYPVAPEVEIMQGTLTSDAQGKFIIRFKVVPDLKVLKITDPVFDYIVSSDVTDINGETRSAQGIVSAGYHSLLLGSSVSMKMNLAKDSLIRITSQNLNGRNTPTGVTVTIQRLRQPDHLFKGRLLDRPDLSQISRQEFYAQFPYDVYGDEDNPETWPVEETVFEKTLNTKSDSVIRLFMGTQQRLISKQGKYLLKLKARDPFGENVERSTWFTIYDPSSKEVPENILNWFVPLITSGDPGQTAKFLIGSKEENVMVIYEIRVHDSIRSREWIKLNDRQLTVEVPIKEEYRGNFAVNFIFIKHNRAFQNSSLVAVPYSNKKLNITWQTFRDKLYPGKPEEWRITIKDAAKKGADAEFLTTMYDESLDAFAPNSWSFSLYRFYYGFYPWSTTNSFRINSGTTYPVYLPTGELVGREYNQLNWFGLSNFGSTGGHRIYKLHTAGNQVVEENTMFDMAPSAAMDQGIVSREFTTTIGGLTADSTGRPGNAIEKNTVIPQIRRDFRETAFFYPALKTDTEGNLVVSFTVPESLTKWKILGFAHTKQLDYGLIEKEAFTQKELMVFPNSPRFVRQGDTVVFSAKVVNMSDHNISGDVRVEFSNAISSKPAAVIVGSSQSAISSLPMTIGKGQSSSFSWKLFIPADPLLSLLQYRITATAGDFSDAEEKAFPVLTNRMLVTEPMPLPVRGKGTFTFSFDKLLRSAQEGKQGNSLKNYHITLEFASNPAWYAIQALTMLADPAYPNADNIFNAFYANSIASYIANSNVKIRHVFETWSDLTPATLLSNLEKNEQLKSALLNETPWVMEAKSESDRKQRIALLFDLNTLSGRLEDNLSKLSKMQTSNGGWPWFEGMPESRYITQDIVTGLGHLDHLGVKNIREDKNCWAMLQKAVRYLDGEIVKDYENVKKYYSGKMDEDHLSTSQIQYLYSRSYFMKDVPVSDAGIKKAFDYFRRQAEKYWMKSDLYSQGMTALALSRFGNKEVAQLSLKSLKERSLHSEELGMYWATENRYGIYQVPIETQSMLIEAFDEIDRDSSAVEEMKIWLLKQKQTQDWKTTRATVEACYALLLRGMDLLSTTPDVKISVGKEAIDPMKLDNNKPEAGTGYFQVTWTGSDITPDMGNIKVVKQNEGVAWGALYWQYFEDLDKITPHQTPLKVEKKLFLHKDTPNGPVLVPLEGTGLSVGDKVTVRIILNVDRTLEFVHMKDMRASSFEPTLDLSGYKYQDGLGYYQTTTDVATNFFFDYLPKGTYVFEYPLVVNASGDYSNGITTIQCMYAPEFEAHSEGIRVKVK
ncbi:MAG: MG2 domain-containing protein [Bacteroidetes bacterium]|nr:MG2 domain-containing protein [Bacteroidota bacterium]